MLKTHEEVFDLVRDYIDVSGDGNTHPFLLKGLPETLKAELEKIEVPCYHCGLLVSPYRERKRRNSPYLSFSCPLHQNVGCARSKDVHELYGELRGMLNAA